ncbi:MAG: hypothetical protein ACI4MJ_07070 [Aristaeellaceae bacterium]
MLEHYMEDFLLLECVREPDGMGGFRTAYEESMAFRGGVTATMSREITVAQSARDAVIPVLVHEWGVTLRCGDIIRRVSDGECYRVTGRSSDMRTPDMAALAYAQVPVERLVNGP